MVQETVPEQRLGERQSDGVPYTDEDLAADLRWWAAANYLTVAQIYLQDNALLREPLRPEHIKPRLLGHWGTTPGLNFIYAHLNRVIKERDSDVLFVCGPGHGGPAMVANTWLEGTYSEIYPDIGEDWIGGAHGLVLDRRLHSVLQPNPRLHQPFQPCRDPFGTRAAGRQHLGAAVRAGCRSSPGRGLQSASSP